jgi:hypothetical protein
MLPITPSFLISHLQPVKSLPVGGHAHSRCDAMPIRRMSGLACSVAEPAGDLMTAAPKTFKVGDRVRCKSEAGRSGQWSQYQENTNNNELQGIHAPHIRASLHNISSKRQHRTFSDPQRHGSPTDPKASKESSILESQCNVANRSLKHQRIPPSRRVMATQTHSGRHLWAHIMLFSRLIFPSR